jgi:hypothetical protein
MGARLVAMRFILGVTLAATIAVLLHSMAVVADSPWQVTSRLVQYGTSAVWFLIVGAGFLTRYAWLIRVTGGPAARRAPSSLAD